MDGSGRVSLRNRQFLRKIEPYLPRYTTVDRVIDGISDDRMRVNDVTEGHNVDETVGVEQPRRSTRIGQTPVRYEASSISLGVGRGR